MREEYQTFTMQDFETEGEPLLIRADYLVEMFELEVTNERGKPIVITLREKDEHFTERQEGDVAEAFAERAWSGHE
jgi:hypothetical protein